MLCPTQAASIQWAFDKPRIDRLYDVESPGAALDRQSHRLHSLVQRPPRDVHRRCIFEWGLCLSQDLLQEIGLVRKEVADVLCSLLLIAAMTGQRQIAHPVIARLAPGGDVVNLKRHVLRPAVGTLPSPFLKQVLSNLVAGKRSLLVRGSADFGVLHLLHVELDQFEADGGDGTPSRQAAYPGQDVADPRLQRRW